MNAFHLCVSFLLIVFVHYSISSVISVFSEKIVSIILRNIKSNIIAMQCCLYVLIYFCKLYICSYTLQLIFLYVSLSEYIFTICIIFFYCSMMLNILEFISLFYSLYNCLLMLDDVHLNIKVHVNKHRFLKIQNLRSHNINLYK